MMVEMARGACQEGRYLAAIPPADALRGWMMTVVGMEQIRYGHLALLPDMDSLTPQKVSELAKIIQVVKDADTREATHGEPVNVLHIALMEVKSPWPLF